MCTEPGATDVSSRYHRLNWEVVVYKMFILYYEAFKRRFFRHGALLFVSNFFCPWLYFSSLLLPYPSGPPARLSIFLSVYLSFSCNPTSSTLSFQQFYFRPFSLCDRAIAIFLLLLSSLSVVFGRTRRALHLFLLYIHFQSFSPNILRSSFLSCCLSTSFVVWFKTHVSHPYNAVDLFTVSYNLNFVVLDSCSIHDTGNSIGFTHSCINFLHLLAFARYQRSQLHKLIHLLKIHLF